MLIHAAPGSTRALSNLTFAALLLFATPALAAAGDGDKDADSSKGEKAEADKASSDKDGKDGKDAKGAKDAADKGDNSASDSDKYDPREDPSKTYRFIGARFRDVIVPQFMVNLFADGGRTVNVPMGGIEFTSRTGHTEFVLGLQYADYSMSSFPFKGKAELDEAYELVDSNLKQVLFTTDILYSVPIDDHGRFAFLVGGSAGLGAVFGSLYRYQAYQPKGGATVDPNAWKPCTGDQPMPTGPTNIPYCQRSDNDHFLDARNNGKGYQEPNWFNGGSTPVVFPWLALQVGLRYKPIKQLQLRLDAGFSTSGFLFGLSAAYGL
jgi:hypothetical protein